MSIGTKLVRPRILRSRDDKPLTLDQIKGTAPAVFQEHAYAGMSAQYAYIPTINILHAMLEQGFQVYEVAQTRPYRGDRDPYAKHMIRFRYPLTNKRVGEIVPELVLVNAHDGTARYYLYAGIYRLICSNGMIVGDTFSKIVVAHRGGDITRSRVLEGSYEIVNDEMPKVMASVKDMRQRIMLPTEQLELAQRALALRYPDTVPSYTAEQLLTVRREVDNVPDLWTVFNRVQENVVMGGYEGRSMMYQRRSTARPVERVGNIVGINRALWDAAMQYLPAKPLKLSGRTATATV